MDYKEIAESVEKFNYVFPIQAADESGNNIVIQEGYEDSIVSDIDINGETHSELTKLHYYKVFTYLKHNQVKVDVFYENGIHLESIQ